MKRNPIGQKGITLVELVVVLGIFSIVGGMLVGIVFQFWVLWGRTNADHVILSDLRNTTNWLFQDGVQTQGLVIRPRTDYLTFEWSDFTRPPTSFSSATYRWDLSTREREYFLDEPDTFRVLDLDGGPPNTQSLARHINFYEDISLRRINDHFDATVASTSYITADPRSSAINLLVQPRPGRVENLPAGGYTIFMKGPATRMPGDDDNGGGKVELRWTASRSGVIGNIYVNGSMKVTGSGNIASGSVEVTNTIDLPGHNHDDHDDHGHEDHRHSNFLSAQNSRAGKLSFSGSLALPDNLKPGGLTISTLADPVTLWVADEAKAQVFNYSETSLLLGAFPLTELNGDPKGITTDGTSFWVLDKKDQVVYRYNMEGEFQDSFGLTTPSEHLEGITTDGASLWVLNKNQFFAGGEVFRYSLAGTFIPGPGSFVLHEENTHPEGITTDGNSLWVADMDVARVFHYSMTGQLLDSFSVAPATHPEGVATDGVSIWVVDKDTRKLYKFAQDGSMPASPSPPETLPFPVTFGEQQLEPFTFDFVGDVDLKNVAEVWLDPNRTVLRPGVYHATGRIRLSKSGVSGTVTFIAQQIVIGPRSDDDDDGNRGVTDLKAFHQTGLLFFSTGTAPDSIKVNRSRVRWRGLFYAPDGGIQLTGSHLIGDGSLYARELEWTGSNSRIAFDPGLY